MRDNAKGGALTEVTFYILLSLYTPCLLYTSRVHFPRAVVDFQKTCFRRYKPEANDIPEQIFSCLLYTSRCV